MENQRIGNPKEQSMHEIAFQDPNPCAKASIRYGSLKPQPDHHHPCCTRVVPAPSLVNGDHQNVVIVVHALVCLTKCPEIADHSQKVSMRDRSTGICNHTLPINPSQVPNGLTEIILEDGNINSGSCEINLRKGADQLVPAVGKISKPT